LCLASRRVPTRSIGRASAIRPALPAQSDATSAQQRAEIVTRETGQLRHRVHFGAGPQTLERIVGRLAPNIGLDRAGRVERCPARPQPVLADLVRRALLPVRNVVVVKIGAIDLLVPGFVTTSVLFARMGAATAIAADLEAGVVDRMRSLPIPRSAVLTGRAVADTAVLVWSLAITTAIGFAVGFRLHGSVSDALLAFGLCVVFGFAFE
jgi:ABC-2 family transporter protein